MSTQDDVLDLLRQLHRDLLNLPTKISISPQQISITTGLSDISENLGTLMAGEFRAGNRKDIGRGFSGMRMTYPPVSYNSELWNLVGAENDALQFGVRASDGKLIAGGGSVVLSSTGISAIAGVIGGWTINTTTITGSGITLDSSGSIQAGFAAGAAGWSIDSNGAAEFNDITIRGEIKSAVFTYDAIQALAGSMGVFRSAGVLRSDAAVPADATGFFMDIQDPAYGHSQLFAVNDFLRVKYGSVSTWLKVTAVTDMTEWWRYSVAKQSGTASYTIKDGTPVIDYGPANHGFLWMTAGGTNGPFYSVYTHAGVPWATITEHVRMGSLSGNWGYATATYGMALGEYAANKPNITIDPTNGLRIRNYSTNVLQFDISGNAIISNKLLMNQTTSAIAIGTTPPTSATVGTGLWIDRTGLYGLNANVQQTYINSIGQMIAGAGNVTLDADGITLHLGTSQWQIGFDPTDIKWKSELSTDGYTVIRSILSGEMPPLGLEMSINAYAGTGNANANITLYAQKDLSNYSQIILDGLTGILAFSISDIHIVGQEVYIGAYYVPTDYVKIYSSNGLQINEIASVVTPSAGWGSIYVKTDNNLYFKNDAGTEYEINERWTYRTTPLTAAAWQGTYWSTVAKTLINLSAVFGVPAGVKAVLVRVAARDSGSLANATCSVLLAPTSTANDGGFWVRPSGLPNNFWAEGTSVVPCNVNGDIYYQLQASGTDTLQVWLHIWGYYL